VRYCGGCEAGVSGMGSGCMSGVWIGDGVVWVIGVGPGRELLVLVRLERPSTHTRTLHDYAPYLYHCTHTTHATRPNG
jgi:hypothetical protein